MRPFAGAMSSRGEATQLLFYVNTRRAGGGSRPRENARACLGFVRGVSRCENNNGAFPRAARSLASSGMAKAAESREEGREPGKSRDPTAARSSIAAKGENPADNRERLAKVGARRMRGVLSELARERGGGEGEETARLVRSRILVTLRARAPAASRRLTRSSLLPQHLKDAF